MKYIYITLSYPAFLLLWLLKPIITARAFMHPDTYHRRVWLRSIREFTLKNWNAAIISDLKLK